VSDDGQLKAPVSVNPPAAAHERRLAALGAFLAAFEAAHGEITAEEMEAAVQRAQERRGTTPGGPRGAGLRAANPAAAAMQRAERANARPALLISPRPPDACLA
jgi:hypothetical protein